MFVSTGGNEGLGGGNGQNAPKRDGQSIISKSAQVIFQPQPQERDAISRTADSSEKPSPLVQFASNVFFVDEGSGCEITVIRLGSHDPPCSCKWKTCPSPYEGTKFEAGQGEVLFGKNQSQAKIHIKLFSDDKFDSTLEFRLQLYDPKDCELGLYLKSSTVKILDDDVFPSNVFRDRILGDQKKGQRSFGSSDWAKGSSFSMLKEYAKFTYAQTPKAKYILMADMVEHVIFIFQLNVSAFLVDALSGKNHPLKALPTDMVNIVYGLCLTVPFGVLHWLNYRRTTWKVTGGARRVLQENLLRKYLNQDEATQFPSSTAFLNTFGHDVTRLVNDGYNKFFVVAKCFGRLLVSFILTLILAILRYMDSGTMILFLALVPFVVFPITMFVFTKFRWHTNTSLQEEITNNNEALVNKVNDVIDNYRMVADYNSRAAVVDDVIADIKRVNKAIATGAGVMKNNVAVVGWVHELLMFGWLVIGATEVGKGLVHGGSDSNAYLQLGTFLLFLSMFKSNGSQFASMFEVYLTIASTYPALWRMVNYMNLVSDSKKRQKVTEFRVEKTIAALEEAKAERPDAKFPMDTVPLIFENVCFSYGDSGDQVQDFNATIPQGKTVSITGKNGSGKATFTKIVGLVLPPGSGVFFVPSHLRVLHVSAEVCMWPGTLAENIFFGLCAFQGLMTDQYKNLSREELERGWRICKMLQFTEDMQKEAENLDSECEVDSLPLSLSQKKMIHLARALIVNPEVLVMHHPTLFLPKDMVKVIARVLKAFVNQKGIAMDPATRHRRRPRTLFYCTVNEYMARCADIRVCLGPQTM